MAGRLHILQPLAFRTLFEEVDPVVLFLGSKGFEKKNRIKRHPLSLFSVDLLVMTEPLLQVASGQALLGKGLGEGDGMMRVGARQRSQDPASRPGGQITPPDRLQSLIRQGA
jgi:hypothetical protein